MVEFGILGTLELTSGGRPVALPRAKPRAVLAMLVLHPNQVVSVDRLSEALWDEDPPPSAANTLQGYVSHLRQVLANDAGADDAASIRTQAPGYLLAVTPERIDACRFERLAAEARRALAAHEPADAADTLAAALSLWRGPALADFADQPFAIGEAARLDELRLVALEDRADAELALGHHNELAGALQALVDQHPLRERLWGQLMLALYRCGRQAEALRAFQDARRILADALGIDPSPTLRRLEADMLAQGDGLDWQPAPGRRGSSYFESAGPGAERELIGREPEVASLDAALQRAVAGTGQLALVSGEPGVGKTRLVEELAQHAKGAQAQVAWGRCFEGEGAAAFWPWTQVVTGLIDRCDPEAVRAALAPGAADIAQIVPEVKEMFPGVEPPPVVDIDGARVRLYEAVTRLLLRLAGASPLVLCIEDIHWADVPSLQLLGVLASRVGGAGILLVATFRDVDPVVGGALADCLAVLARSAHVNRLALAGLNATEVGRLLVSITGSEPSVERVAAVHGRTEGNPFFVTELARELDAHDVEGARALGEIGEVPVGVRDVIRRRLARLPKGTRQLLAVAAVVGREFDLDVLFAVSQDQDATLDQLEPALREDLVIQSREERTRYRFSHAVVAETIYGDSTPVARARLHHRVGVALEQVHQGDGAVHLVELAHHFYRAVPAGPADKGLAYAMQAAEAAAARLAYEQAEEQLQRAVELARRMPASERASRELNVQMQLYLLLVKRSYSSDGLNEASTRALELARGVHDVVQVAASLLGLAVFSLVRSTYDTTQACGEELVALGEHSDEPVLVLAGSTMLGMVGFLRGELEAAHEHNARAISLGDGGSGVLVPVFGFYPPSNCLHFSAVVEWMRGDFDAARRLIDEGIELASEPGRELSLANALMFDAMLGAFAGDPDAALASANKAIELCERFGFHLYHSGSAIVRGWAVARLGDVTAGTAEMEAWYAVTQELHATCLRPFHLGLLADARRGAGRVDAALESVEQAIAYSDSAGDRFWDAELYRLRGELLAAVPHRVGEAEASLREAIAIATRQGAFALKARAGEALGLFEASRSPGVSSD